MKNGEISVYTVKPEDFGLPRAALDTLRVDSAAQSLAMIRRVLDNEPGPARDIVMLNAGAAIYAAGLAASMGDGVDRAGEVLADGKARETLDRLVRVSNSV